MPFPGWRGNRALLGTALSLALVGCGDKSPADEGGPAGGPRLRVVAGGNASDTVQAEPVQALVVEVLDSAGRPGRGVAVRFEVVAPRDPARASERGMAVCRLGAIHCRSTDTALDDSTDAVGKAAALVRFGTIAGPAWIRLTVPLFGLEDSVAYTVLAGAADRLRLAIRDSTVYVGSGYAVGGYLLDRVGNRRAADAVTYTAFGSAATIDASGTFRGTSVGRAGAVLRAGPLADTAWISVPPRGVIAAHFIRAWPSMVPEGIATINLDGSGYHFLTPASAPYYGLWPDWMPDGRQIVYDGADGWLWAVDTLGTKRRVTATGTRTSGEIFGVAARDGSVFFAANGGGDYGTALWRSAAVGTIPQRIGPTPHDNANNWEASPAPDGLRLAYVSVNSGGLAILDVATGAPTLLRKAASVPRWSPVGDRIAYNGAGVWYDARSGNALYVIRPDGSGQRRIAAGLLFSGRADWSGDGSWLIAKQGARLVLIDAVTDSIIPLAWSGTFNNPTWKK